MTVQKPLPLEVYREQRRAWIAYQVDVKGRTFAEIAPHLGVHPVTVGREYAASKER